MARFSGKVAIITGSSNGIGRGTALLFAKEGAQVTITGRNAERLEETRQQILKAGVSPNNVNAVVADLTVSAGQDELVNSTIQKFGKIDILVNNAGAAIPDRQVPKGFGQGIENFDANLNLNIRSVVELTNKVVPHLAATKGEIVNISSIASGPHGQGDMNYYSVAKAALDQYTRNSALSLIDQGIRVNSINPGLVATGFGEAMGMPKDVGEKFGAQMAATKWCIPVGFTGQPEHIAQVIAFLADRNASGYMIGQQLIVDGGSSLVMGMSASNFFDLLQQ